MATKIDNSLTIQPTNSTDALFRLWVQFIHDTFITTGGWVDPGDSGQVTIASATKPSSTNTKAGYRIYRMADTLQATSPIYLRVDYGSSSSVNTPSMWLTVGTGSNGSGTITGALWNGGGSAAPNITQASNTTVGKNCYGSASTSRIQLCMFVDSNSSLPMALSIERSKNTSGNDTGDGVLLAYGTGAVSGLNASRYIICAGGSQPLEEVGLNYVLSTINPSSFAGDTGVGLILHFKGPVVQPGLGICVIRSSDLATESSFTVSLYGSTRTYQHLNGYNAASNGNVADTATRVCMRFD